MNKLAMLAFNKKVGGSGGGGGGGVSSWNDLTDKPFGEAFTDSIEWDGVVGLRPVIPAGDMNLVKVSDILVNDLSDVLGATATMIMNGSPMDIEFTEANTMGAYGLVLNQDTFTVFISEGFDPSMMGMSAELAPGVYFLEPSEAIPFYVSKITFPKPLSTIKKLDMKYIPLEDFPEEAPTTWDEITDKPFYDTGFEYTWDGEIGDRWTAKNEFSNFTLTYVYMGQATADLIDLKTRVVAEVKRGETTDIIDASKPTKHFVGVEYDYYPDVTLMFDYGRAEYNSSTEC
jgi:hypothetical protein